MTENEEEYSEYVMDLSRIRVTMLSLLSGFTFTVIVLFLTQLPNPSSFMSQLTLLFLAVLFGLMEFLLAWQCIIVIGLYKVRNAPPRAKTELTAFNLLMQVVFSLWGLSIVLMFLLWSLIYLALVSGIIWVLVVIAIEIIARRMLKRLGWRVTNHTKVGRRS